MLETKIISCIAERSPRPVIATFCQHVGLTLNYWYKRCRPNYGYSCSYMINKYRKSFDKISCIHVYGLRLSMTNMYIIARNWTFALYVNVKSRLQAKVVKLVAKKSVNCNEKRIELIAEYNVHCISVTVCIW